MFGKAREFVKDAGEWGIASWAAALATFAIGIWEHTHDKPVSAFILICATVPLFWIGGYIAWTKKTRAFENERLLHGGPEISFGWGAIPPLNTRKTLFIENSGNIDAYELKVDDIGLNRTACAARFQVIPKCPRNSREALQFELVGNSVPPNHKNEIEMVVYASGNDFSKDEKGRDLVDFPIRVIFEEYGGARYEANFQFLADPYLEKVNIHRVSRKRIN
ncbi:MAG: hypothetical protein WAM78_10050 [Candidatus Sulfotelmatobacter sp.]